MATRTAITQPQTGLLGEARTMKAIGGRTALSTTDLTTGNIVEAFIVPAGFVVTGGYMIASDMDSGAALTLSVGDGALGTRFFNASTVGQAGGFVAVTASILNTGFAYTADTKILITCTLQGSASVAGTLDVFLLGFNNS